MPKAGFALVLLGLAAVTASCGDDDDHHEQTPCDRVCACVANNGGDMQYCYDECNKTVQDGGNQRASCRVKLALFGLSQCDSTCDALPTSS